MITPKYIFRYENKVYLSNEQLDLRDLSLEKLNLLEMLLESLGIDKKATNLENYKENNDGVKNNEI